MAPEGSPVRALHVGGGGFTLPAYLAATRPGSDSLVLEIDADLVALDRRRLGLRTGPDLRVVAGDARVELARQPSAGRDLVIGDAFGHLVVPWHLTTREFVDDVHRVLRPGGVFALNVIDRPSRRLVRAEVATVASVFANVLLIAPPSAVRGETTSNFVLLASDGPLPVDALRGRLAGTTALVSGQELNRFTGGARVLTDDYAPVDQLLAGGL
jgi:spermidine synthase